MHWYFRPLWLFFLMWITVGPIVGTRSNESEPLLHILTLKKINKWNIVTGKSTKYYYVECKCGLHSIESWPFGISWLRTVYFHFWWTCKTLCVCIGLKVQTPLYTTLTWKLNFHLDPIIRITSILLIILSKHLLCINIGLFQQNSNNNTSKRFVSVFTK